MDSRFTPFILIELPQLQARRTKIILGTLFLLICVLASLAIASKAAASPMETGKPNTNQTKEIQTRTKPEQATQAHLPAFNNSHHARDQPDQGWQIWRRLYSAASAGRFWQCGRIISGQDHPRQRGARYCQMMCWTMPISISTPVQIMG